MTLGSNQLLIFVHKSVLLIGASPLWETTYLMMIPLSFMRGKFPVDPTKTVKPRKSLSTDPDDNRSEWASWDKYFKTIFTII